MFAPGWLAAEDTLINIYYKKELGQVNKKVFGNNFIAYDPSTYEDWTSAYYGYSDYGAGIWDAQLGKPVEEAVKLAKEAGIRILRFPGGCGAHHYDWKKAIGKDRIHFLYGIDEFLATCAEIGSEAVITVSYFTGNENDAADLVEYLNCPNDGSNPNGGIIWAAKRAKNGHEQPYNVQYFEIGNEDWHGDHRQIKAVLPKDYAQRYLKYYHAMKAVDCSIKIGAILCEPEWDSKIAQIIKDKLDFGIIHIYPAYEINIGHIEKIDAQHIFSTILDTPIIKDEGTLQNTLRLLREASGKNIPLSVTEYNSGFTQEEPIPYRHCLGAALLNAELLRIFMKPEHHILMANYWQFCNNYWGMIANGFDGDYPTLHKTYYKRPNYYVYELYNSHFGDVLIEAQVTATSKARLPFLSVNASKNQNNNKLFIMVINKDWEQSITATIHIQDFQAVKEVNAWILNGPSIASTNENNPDNVKITERKIKTEGELFPFTFEPHSLTAIEINP